MMYSLFVGRLPNTATKGQLTELFSAYGIVKDVYIHPFHNRPFGYGFVRFSEPECVVKAAQETGEWMLDGNVLKVEISAESRETLKVTMAAKRPSSKAAMKDNNVRARVREACHSINRNLDLVHGDRPLDSSWVLSHMEDMPLSYSARLTGIPSSSALTTEDTLLKKLSRGYADNHNPAESRNNHCNITERLNSLLSSLETHCRNTVVAPPLGQSTTSRCLRNGPEHVLKELAEFKKSSSHGVSSASGSQTTSPLFSASSRDSSTESEPATHPNNCLNFTFQNKTEWQHNSGVQNNKSRSCIQTDSPSDPTIYKLSSSKDQKIGEGGAQFLDSWEGLDLPGEKEKFLPDSQHQSRSAKEQFTVGHTMKESVTEMVKEKDSVGFEKSMLSDEQEKSDRHQLNVLMANTGSQQDRLSVCPQDSLSTQLSHVQNYNSASVARMGRGRKLLDKLKAMETKETSKNSLRREVRPLGGSFARGRGAILLNNFDN